ncbi:MAG: AAA family ATPase, partial [Gammaproteobacteria bacterium]|nr:AAA family ATPase [Gammaproteobacteria bacterium]
MHTPPLAEKLRPTALSEVVGQEHLIGPNGWITRIIKQGTPLSILLWGPPGCGKTTIAKLYAKAFDAQCVSFSAVLQGSAELKKTIQDAENNPLFQQKIIIFIDEIHTLVGAGAAEGAIDASNMLKPALARGELHCVGA